MDAPQHGEPLLGGYLPPPPPGQWRPPGVWPWFVAYCIVMAFFCLCGCGLGLVFFLVDPQDLEMERVEAWLVGAVRRP